MCWGRTGTALGGIFALGLWVRPLRKRCVLCSLQVPLLHWQTPSYALGGAGSPRLVQIWQNQ